MADISYKQTTTRLPPRRRIADYAVVPPIACFLFSVTAASGPAKREMLYQIGILGTMALLGAIIATVSGIQLLGNPAPHQIRRICLDVSSASLNWLFAFSYLGTVLHELRR